MDNNLKNQLHNAVNALEIFFRLRVTYKIHFLDRNVNTKVQLISLTMLFVFRINCKLYSVTRM